MYFQINKWKWKITKAVRQETPVTMITEAGMRHGLARLDIGLRAKDGAK